MKVEIQLPHTKELDSVAVQTFTATIHCGLKEGNTGLIHTLDEARKVCQDYVDEIGLCVSFTPTEYIYTDGAEPGVAIGLINYPRFPSTPNEVKNKAANLAYRLMIKLNQYMLSIVFPDETIMLINTPLKRPADNQGYPSDT